VPNKCYFSRIIYHQHHHPIPPGFCRVTGSVQPADSSRQQAKATGQVWQAIQPA